MEAFFAKMPPGAVIKPHTDNTNFVLTAHLGLKIPKGEKTWINVGDKKNVWKYDAIAVLVRSAEMELCTGGADTSGTEKAMKAVRQARLEPSGGSTSDLLKPKLKACPIQGVLRNQI